jgi:hypothetical protein
LKTFLVSRFLGTDSTDAAAVTLGQKSVSEDPSPDDPARQEGRCLGELSEL